MKALSKKLPRACKESLAGPTHLCRLAHAVTNAEHFGNNFVNFDNDVDKLGGPS